MAREAHVSRPWHRVSSGRTPQGESQTTAVTCGRRVVVVEEAGAAVGRVVACKWVSTSRGDMYVCMCVCMYSSERGRVAGSQARGQTDAFSTG